jgi:hypothetical protein
MVLYPSVQAACVRGLTDLFNIAASIALDQQRDNRAPLRVTHWQPAHSGDTKLSNIVRHSGDDESQGSTH